MPWYKPYPVQKIVLAQPLPGPAKSGGSLEAVLPTLTAEGGGVRLFRKLSNPERPEGTPGQSRVVWSRDSLGANPWLRTASKWTVL